MDTIAKRFWAKVRCGDGCWEWIGTRISSGYGQLSVCGRNVYAHRISYEIHFGSIPDGMFVLHSCDNPPCVNPGHLRAGNRHDNAMDAVERSGLMPPHVPGSKCGAAKLTEADVIEMRREFDGLRGTKAFLARKYGITKTNVACILAKKTWRHVV